VPLTLMVSNTTTAFSAPTGTATFSDGAAVLGTASQNASPYTFTAVSLAAGSHVLTANYGGGSGSAASSSNTITIQVVEAQTITFGPLSNAVLGSGTVTLVATASSGLTVSYVSTTQGVCTVTAVRLNFCGAE